MTIGPSAIPASLKSVANNDYKSLTPYVKKMAAQLDWGVPVETVLMRFSKEAKSKLIARIISSVKESHRFGGNLADTFEALIGAIFLDQGINTAKKFVLGRLDRHIQGISISGIGQNYKAKLQEFTQSHLEYRTLPVYHLVDASGPDHNKIFTVDVMLDNRVIGTGTGRSKKAAEMEAAHSACQHLSI